MLNEIIRYLIKEFLDQNIAYIGLITAQNPQNEPRDKDWNRDANKRLLDNLKSMGYEPMPTHYYGENGYLVPNIDKRHLISLGRSYDQQSVIWGKKLPEDRNGLTFEWQLIENGKVRGEKISHHPFVVPNFD